MALPGAPTVLLADEPTAEVSAEEEYAILDLLEPVARRATAPPSS